MKVILYLILVDKLKKKNPVVRANKTLEQVPMPEPTHNEEIKPEVKQTISSVHSHEKTESVELSQATQMKSDIKFLKEEVISLRKRVRVAEATIAELEAESHHRRAASAKHINTESKSSEHAKTPSDAASTGLDHEKKTIDRTKIAQKMSFVDIMVIGLIITILIAGCLTLKKLYRKV